MRNIFAIILIGLFVATCLGGLVAWILILCNSIHLFILTRKMKLQGHLRLNPLNVIFYPELLAEEGLMVRRRIYASIRWFVGLIAFGFLLGGVAYVIGPFLR